MKPGRELDALVAEKIFGLKVGWQRFSCWHPGIYAEAFSEPNWSVTKFQGVPTEPYEPKYYERDGKRFESVLTEDYQEFGYLQPAGGQCGSFPIPKYSTDIAAAWEVVEKLQTHNPFWDDDGFMEFELTLARGENGTKEWYCNFGVGLRGAYALTAPHAICLAALKAVV